ncbi:putative inactive receptor-like protein kinase [Prunus yedoensis var. nudiflora]|uniref:Putative inactive receptor-like protein kinase n=1 Tax=Prunus yedoensis var. nudiflora TaxID=2094558 RepID=A0A314XS84_PRUYE|nr:putative inactive receptor-like protein kinase [Prunus yedoensis var. nudiflora]
MNKKWKFSRLKDRLGMLGMVVYFAQQLLYGDHSWGIGELKELEVLDLGYNNFSGPLPADLGSNFSLAILLLDNNRLLENHLAMKDPFHGTSLILNTLFMGECSKMHLSPPPEATNFLSFAPFIPNKTQRPEGSEPARPPNSNPTSPPTAPASSPSLSAPVPTSLASSKNFASKHKVALLTGGTGVAVSLAISILVLYLYKSNKVATVKPWATGLSGQLQKAFVTGVPNLKRSELEAACEDFSNVIGSSPIGTVYKGTLSSGVEIAVASLLETSANCWCSNLELQYRKKIKTLSKVSHKNFVSLIGYCEEEEPFTRMMVFEYAPNGTLFEHLHIKEAEHLDWIMRMRIAMGVAYCLDYMHQLNPPIAHNNLNSSLSS